MGKDVQGSTKYLNEDGTKHTRPGTVINNKQPTMQSIKLCLNRTMIAKNFSERNVIFFLSNIWLEYLMNVTSKS